MRITSVIFDCDGVLLDTEPIYTEAANAVLAPFGKTLPLQLKLSLLGQSGSNVANTMVSTLQLPITPAEYEKRAKMEEQSRFYQCAYKPGAIEAVQRIKNMGLPIGLATSSVETSFAIKSSDKQDFFTQFDNIVTGDLVKAPKPAPEIFQTTFKKLQERQPELTPEACLVIEDSPAGLRGVKSAGMEAAWLLDDIYDMSWYSQFTDLEAIPKFTSLLQILDHYFPFHH